MPFSAEKKKEKEISSNHSRGSFLKNSEIKKIIRNLNFCQKIRNTFLIN